MDTFQGIAAMALAHGDAISREIERLYKIVTDKNVGDAEGSQAAYELCKRGVQLAKCFQAILAAGMLAQLTGQMPEVSTPVTKPDDGAN